MGHLSLGGTQLCTPYVQHFVFALIGHGFQKNWWSNDQAAGLVEKENPRLFNFDYCYMMIVIAETQLLGMNVFSLAWSW